MIELSKLSAIFVANLRLHTAATRERLALSPNELERLADLPPGTVNAIEQGGEVILDEIALTRLTRTLGLSDFGLPRPIPGTVIRRNDPTKRG